MMPGSCWTGRRRLSPCRTEGWDGQAVLSLALESGCSAYDCEFAWLARTLRVPLITADQQVLGAFPDTAVPGDVFLASENEER